MPKPKVPEQWGTFLDMLREPLDHDVYLNHVAMFIELAVSDTGLKIMPSGPVPGWRRGSEEAGNLEWHPKASDNTNS